MRYGWSMNKINDIIYTNTGTHTHLRHYRRLIDFFTVDPSIQTAFFFQVCYVDIYSRTEPLSREIFDHIQFVSATTAQFLVSITSLM